MGDAVGSFASGEGFSDAPGVAPGFDPASADDAKFEPALFAELLLEAAAPRVADELAFLFAAVF